MRVLLVFPPFAYPTYIPLGICQLKAFIEKRNDGIKIKCLDLNLEYHDLLIDRLSKDKKYKKTAQIIAGNIFKTQKHRLHFKNIDKISNDFISLLKSWHEKHDENIGALFNSGVVLDDILIEVANIALAEEFDVIGISNMLSTQWNFSCLLARLVREFRPDSKIVFGGNNFADNDKSNFYDEIMDYIISGEGEIGFEQLLKCLQLGIKPKNVSSLIYRNQRALRSTKKKEIKNLECIADPDFSDLKLKQYYLPEIVLPVYTSRSCPWKRCTYCVHYATFQSFRQREQDAFYKQVSAYYAQGYRFFNIIDEMVLPNYIDKFCDRIISTGLEIFWHCTCSPRGFSSKLLIKMYKAGCRVIYWGVESGSQSILEKMKKGTNTAEIQRILRDANKAGIFNYVMIILGFPGETQKEFDDTCKFLEYNKDYISSVHVSLFFLYKGSEIFNRPKMYGITKIIDKNQKRRNYMYEVEKGFSYENIVLLYNSHQRYFDSFSKVSNSFNIIRDLALIYHAR